MCGVYILFLQLYLCIDICIYLHTNILIYLFVSLIFLSICYLIYLPVQAMWNDMIAAHGHLVLPISYEFEDS